MGDQKAAGKVIGSPLLLPPYTPHLMAERRTSDGLALIMHCMQKAIKVSAVNPAPDPYSQANTREKVVGGGKKQLKKNVAYIWIVIKSSARRYL